MARHHSHRSKSHHRKERRGKGCLFWGCTSIFGLSCAALTLAGLLIYVLISRRATELPTFAPSPDRYASVQERVQEFTDALDLHKAASLSLDSDDLNTLLQFDPRAAFYKDQIRVEIEGDRFNGYVSFAVNEYEELRRWLPTSAFLNGKASFMFAMQQGLPAAFLTSLQIKGVVFPETIISRLRDENLLRPLLHNQLTRKRAAQLQAIRVKNGALILFSRGDTDGADSVESAGEGAR